MASLNEVATLARTLMDEHDLGRVPFEFDGGKRRLGCHHYTRIGNVYITNKITISKHYAALLPLDEIKDTILHEIAHAQTPGHDHDHVWRAAARRLGHTGNRCATPSAAPEGAWEGRCPNGHKSEQYRAPRRMKSCGKCDRNYKAANVLVWYKNGKKVSINDMPATFRRDFQFTTGTPYHTP